MSARNFPLLFEAFPGLEPRLPWLPLADGVPTPVEPLAGLARAARVRAPLWVKRDDVAGHLYGGNKVRKLEWLLADARAKGARRVVTVAAWGSHHALATALFARYLGMRAGLVLYKQPMSAHAARNLSAALGAGASVRCASSLVGAAIAYALARRDARRDDGRPAHGIPPGGSSALGTLGGVECGLEVARQVAAGALPPPRFVYTAAGTCGTAAGLALGLALGQRWAPTLQRPRVRAVRVVPAIVANEWAIRALARKAARLLEDLGAGPLPPPAEVEIVGDQLGRGYGRPTEAGERALALAADQGLHLEPTYTAKTVAALLARAEREHDEVHLYVHTLSGADLTEHVERAERDHLAPRGCDPRRLVASGAARSRGPDTASPDGLDIRDQHQATSSEARR